MLKAPALPTVPQPLPSRPLFCTFTLLIVSCLKLEIDVWGKKGFKVRFDKRPTSFLLPKTIKTDCATSATILSLIFRIFRRFFHVKVIVKVKVEVKAAITEKVETNISIEEQEAGEGSLQTKVSLN